MKFENTKVLLVEDDAVMSTFVVKTLQRLGVETIEVCGDGISAMKMLASFVPDVILTDVHMKPMNGIEFIQKLRANLSAGIRSIPVIFMSADSSQATLGGTMALGSVAYILKPPRMETLKAKLIQAIQSRA